jgi:alpha-mannosidase
LLKSPIVPAVHEDTEDPWAMQEFQYRGLGKAIGQFKLMDAKQAQAYSHIKTELAPVRMIEDGSVRTIIEALYKYNNSFAVIKYIFYKNIACIEINADILWCEKDKALKLHIPADFEAEFIGETAYGVQSLLQTGIEEDFQKWCALEGKYSSISVVNNGIYAASCSENELAVTLLRSPAYSGHPINSREILHQDRYTQRIDQGEREFAVKLYFDTDKKEISRLAQTENEKPFALSFFPQGKGEKIKPFMSVEGSGVMLTAFKQADDKKGYILRLFNSLPEKTECTLKMNYFNISEKLQLIPFEIKTFRVQKGTLKENNLKEQDIQGENE